VKTGREFLRQMVDNAIGQHKSLIEDLKDHERETKDHRYRELCARHRPKMEEHQRMLESYRDSMGEKSGSAVKEVLGSVFAIAKDAVDALRESDFLRLVSDVVMIRQAQDTFATFAVVGTQIGEPKLAEIGKTLERDHEMMAKEFNELVRTVFVEHVQERGPSVREAAD